MQITQGNVSDFRFNVKEIGNIEELIDYYYEDSPDFSLKNQAPGFVKAFVPKNLLSKMDDIMEKGEELQEDALNAAASVKLPQFKRLTKKKTVNAPVRDVLDYYKENDLFNKKRLN